MSKAKPKLSSQILEEASSWFIDFSEGEVDAIVRDDFNAWLRRSPEHVRAYLQISNLWEDAGALEKVPNLDFDALIARAKLERNVFPLEIRGAPDVRSQQRKSSIRLPLALAASVFVAASTGLAGWYTLNTRNTYATEIGEQRSITLEDGSSVELNAVSRLKVHFTGRERAVELLEGQALFRVAKNPARPFVVYSGNTSVRAVGTQFDVYRKRTGTVVTVVEGRVAVTPPSGVPEAGVSGLSGLSPSLITQQGKSGTDSYSSAAADPTATPVVLLTAGEQLTITPVAVSTPKRANVAKTTAWTEKKLVFEETPLREVIEEFNRYNRQKVVIRDPELYDFHVTAIFASTDSSRVIEFLRQRFGVTMSRSGDEIEITRRGGGSNNASLAP